MKLIGEEHVVIYPVFNEHNCEDYGCVVPCPDPGCDDGYVVVVNSHNGRVIYAGDCDECDGYGEVQECCICGARLGP